MSNDVLDLEFVHVDQNEVSDSRHRQVERYLPHHLTRIPRLAPYSSQTPAHRKGARFSRIVDPSRLSSLLGPRSHLPPNRVMLDPPPE